eukprot:Hpha_TRINITY_DN8575_c0_g1::TRINITY_DN8575_c0_g1_i2::g.146259::m.146259
MPRFGRKYTVEEWQGAHGVLLRALQVHVPEKATSEHVDKVLARAEAENLTIDQVYERFEKKYGVSVSRGGSTPTRRRSWHIGEGSAPLLATGPGENRRRSIHDQRSPYRTPDHKSPFRSDRGASPDPSSPNSPGGPGASAFLPGDSRSSHPFTPYPSGVPPFTPPVVPEAASTRQLSAGPSRLQTGVSQYPVNITPGPGTPRAGGGDWIAEHHNAAWVLCLTYVPPILTFLTFFTELGIGSGVKRFLAAAHIPAVPSFGLAVLILLLLYVADASLWEGGCALFFRRFMLGMVAILFILGAIMSFNQFAYAPIMVFTVLLPLYFVGIKHYLFAHVQTIFFFKPMAVASGVVGVICLATSLAWSVKTDHLWSDRTGCEFAARLRDCVYSNDSITFNSMEAALRSVNLTKIEDSCEVLQPGNLTDTIGVPGVCWTFGWLGKGCLIGCEEPTDAPCDPMKTNCLAAFLLWSGMYIVSIAITLFGFVLYFISKALRPRMGRDQSVTYVLYFVLTLLLGTWIAAQIAGASMAIANVLYAMVGVGFVLLVGLVGVSVGWQALHQRLEDVPLISRLMGMGSSDWMRAFVILVGLPAFLAFFALSILNQLVRSFRGSPHAKDDHGIEHVLTKQGHKWWVKLQSWHKASVLQKLVIWGFAFFVLQVGAGKIVVLFLSWLNEVLSGFSLPVVSLIIFIIGLVLLLLPMVPGIPVYLTVGVLTGRAGEKELGSFTLGVLFAVALAMVLKMVAIAVQQEGIGGPLGNKLWVKRTVGINSMTIRAIRHVLEKPGLSKEKVFVLLGGPDWPTSVLTGILRLSLAQMIIGSLPFVFPIGLTVAAGASMLHSDSEGIWSSLTTVFQLVAAMVNLICFLAALSAIAQTTDDNYEDIAPPPQGRGVPDDPEVLKADMEGKKAALAMLIGTEWSKVPGAMRLCIGTSGFLMWISFLFFTFASGKCWEKVEVTTKLNGPPLYGDWLALVKAPHGLMGLAAHFVSLGLFMLFRSWAKSAAKSVSAEEVEAAMEQEDGKERASPPSKQRSRAESIARWVPRGGEKMLVETPLVVRGGLEDPTTDNLSFVSSPDVSGAAGIGGRQHTGATPDDTGAVPTPLNRQRHRRDSPTRTQPPHRVRRDTVSVRDKRTAGSSHQTPISPPANQLSDGGSPGSPTDLQRGAEGGAVGFSSVMHRDGRGRGQYPPRTRTATSPGDPGVASIRMRHDIFAETLPQTTSASGLMTGIARGPRRASAFEASQPPPTSNTLGVHSTRSGRGTRSYGI